jgi:hypothetical protein
MSKARGDAMTLPRNAPKHTLLDAAHLSMAFKLVETGKLTWPSPSLGLVFTVTPVCKVASWDLQHARLILRRRQHIHRIDALRLRPRRVVGLSAGACC